MALPTQVLNYHDVQLYASDVQLFSSHQWLNDNAINFYLQYLYRTVCASRSDMLLMDPVIVACMLFQCDDDDEFLDLARGVALLEKELCIIPVNDVQSFADGSGSHWSLLVYRRAANTFEHWDSSAGSNMAAAARVAQSFFKMLRLCIADATTTNQAKAEPTIVSMTEGPQQRNGYDCGMYVLLTAEFLVKQHLQLIGADAKVVDHVNPKLVTQARQEIPRIINRLRSEANQ
ncbi:TPA: hypothetical protein N0F65_003369 [Lagenidium giganteum]|uniref:Ubiquitin-like protease family profile domain-containing protein n=1 Tax=Lagenidium giganteum TaxID=4803 RepID=A0AAV2ZC39_9STRA|nr:TPA: hypothetical protein N0F65_003369 [Lagenidium giganteum]